MSRPLHWMPQRVRQPHTSLDITRCALGLGPGDTPGGDTPGLEGQEQQHEGQDTGALPREASLFS